MHLEQLHALALFARQADAPRPLPAFVRPLYYSFHLVGAALLVVLVITLALVRPLHRTATLLNLCVAWIALPLMMSFLLFAGQVNNPEPSFPVCLTSAAFSLGAAPIGGLAAFSMVMQIFLLVVHPIKMGDHERWITLGLVALPWVAGVSFLFATLGMGWTHRDLVVRNKFYCIVDSDGITDSSSGMIIIAMILSVLLILTIILKVWRSPLRHSRRSHFLDLQLCIRLLVFGAYVLFAIIAGVVSFWDYTSLVPDMVISTIPLAVFCIFASQRDVLGAWGWRRKAGGAGAGAGGQSGRATRAESAHPTRGTPRASGTASPQKEDDLEAEAGLGLTDPLSRKPSPKLSTEKDTGSAESTLVTSFPAAAETSASPESGKEKQLDVFEEDEQEEEGDETLHEPRRRGGERKGDMEEGRRPSFARRPEDDRFVLPPPHSS